MSFQKAPKRSASLDGNLITIHADPLTVVTRPVRESDKDEWPDLFVKKRGRPKKVAHDDQGNSEPGSE